MPLIARGHTVGAVTLAFAESRRTYEPADVELAEELARRAAFAVDNARLYRAEREAGERVAFLAEVGRVLGSTLDYEATLKRVAELAVTRLSGWCAIHRAGSGSSFLGCAHRRAGASEHGPGFRGSSRPVPGLGDP